MLGILLVSVFLWLQAVYYDVCEMRHHNCPLLPKPEHEQEVETMWDGHGQEINEGHLHVRGKFGLYDGGVGGVAWTKQAQNLCRSCMS